MCCYTASMIRDKQLNVRIPRDLHKQAKIVSAQTGRSLSEVIEELLREWTEKQKQRESK